MSMDPKRRATVIRLAAEYVRRKDRERVMWSPVVRIARLDESGKPIGEPVECGPILLTLGDE